MQTNKEKIIIKHVLKNKENLEMALDIIFLRQKIRERIVKTFLKELKGFICGKLDLDRSQWDWETELCDKPYGKNYINLGVYRKFDVLPKSVYIVLQKQSKDLSNLTIGVIADSESNALMQYLSSKLDKELKKDTRSGDWIWCQSRKPSNWDYADWTNQDTLIKMHTERCRVVKDIGNHLLRIIKVSKPVIEEWVEQNPASP